MPKTYADLVREAIAIAGEITPSELSPKMGSVVLIDCREPEEFARGVIPGASLVPRGSIESAVARAGLAQDAPIVIYCASGARSALAARTLHEMGYTSATSLAGGIQRWMMEGGTVEVSNGGLTAEQADRYARHLMLPEVGEKGQRKLLESKVMVIGAGGLSSPAALYLAAAGVGTIGIVDFDLVDASNLQRQILHSTERVGAPKVESARRTLNALNPDVEIIAHRARIDASNAESLLEGYDVIVDGSDNFPTRYLINDASLRLGIPVAHGSIFRFDGQASFFVPYQGPCYRCIFPEAPPPELAPNCAEAGVLGVLPGIIGSIQATETIKHLLGIGKSLNGRLLVYDALDQSFTEVKARRRPDCPACADPDSPPDLVNYDPTCRV
ncbi:MAG: molybdopterin-synthase adenylyltransferase MoeB [Acidimicrobiia bacterium]|nr:molybdopterin-synthase adenylyltransferase MoeB [Acidimicrobiia bacterium]